MEKCVAPDQIPDWQLEAHLDGTTVPGVEEHLNVCAHCSDRLAELKALTQVLEVALHRADCPTSDDLRAFRWRQLRPERALEVQAHLATCISCTRGAALYVGSPIDRNADGDVPATSAHRRLLAMARLVPPQLLALPELRGVEAKAAVYEVAGRDWQVTLEQVAEATGYTLLGQLLGPEPSELASAYAMLLADGKVVQEVELDASGWFVLRSLAAAPYGIWIETPGVRIQISDIEVGMSPWQSST